YSVTSHDAWSRPEAWTHRRGWMPLAGADRGGGGSRLAGAPEDASSWRGRVGRSGQVGRGQLQLCRAFRHYRVASDAEDLILGSMIKGNRTQVADHSASSGCIETECTKGFCADVRRAQH